LVGEPSGVRAPDTDYVYRFAHELSHGPVNQDRKRVGVPRGVCVRLISPLVDRKPLSRFDFHGRFQDNDDLDRELGLEPPVRMRGFVLREDQRVRRKQDMVVVVFLLGLV
jgi:hypothetical protein